MAAGITKDLSVYNVSKTSAKIQKVPWDKLTDAERDFSRVIDALGSQNQMERIAGRVELKHFEKAYTTAQLDAMYERIYGEKAPNHGREKT